MAGPDRASTRERRPVVVSRRLVRLPRRLLAVLGPDAGSVGQSLVALGVNSSTSLLAGAALGSITDTLARYPGLLVMVPAAVGMRGNVFSALGSRISTSVHVGDFRLSLRPRTVLGDNVAASMGLTLLLALLLAVIAKVLTSVVGVQGDVSVWDLATISIVGGVLASVVVLLATLVLVVAAVRREWDLDNLVAPVVSTLGDVVTIPALWLATFALGHGSASAALTATSIAVSAVVGAACWRSRRRRLRRIMRESVPILVAAAALSSLAGLVLERRLLTLEQSPALLVLVPAFVSSAGALGGLLTANLGTSLHLGSVAPERWPQRSVRIAMRDLAVLAVPVYVFNAVGANLVADLLGQAGPGDWETIAASLLGAVGAVGFVLAVSYYGTIAAVRMRVDPDTFGIPIVTSSVDFAGTVALIAAITALGLI